MPICGKPLIAHTLQHIECVRRAQLPPIIVVGYKAKIVMKQLGPQYRYVIQKEQRGTGHAVLQARETVKGQFDHIVVLYGDHPYIPAETIDELIATHLRQQTVLTMMTVTVEDFADWRISLYDYGRVLRDEQGTIVRIVEPRDATEAQLEIREVVPSYFCFEADWLWTHLEQLQTDNTQGEYYLTDMPGLAIREGQKIVSLACDALFALGVNNREELHNLERLLCGQANK